MSFSLIKELVDCVEAYDNEVSGEKDLKGFSVWLSGRVGADLPSEAPDWVGKSKGRSVESVINTSLVHLFRYAKLYSKLAVNDSPFTTIDEVIFLLNLTHSGSMSKTALIELNIHEKSTGIQIINRLLEKGFITEEINESDKRSRNIGVTLSGKAALDKNMDKVRQASKLVVANLSSQEKLQLMILLQKLEVFHQHRYKEGLSL
jgi:MarR family transcriptional regulator, lower aerobic nicotinate degradation pathway regulator